MKKRLLQKNNLGVTLSAEFGINRFVTPSVCRNNLFVREFVRLPVVFGKGFVHRKSWLVGGTAAGTSDLFCARSIFGLSIRFVKVGKRPQMSVYEKQRAPHTTPFNLRERTVQFDGRLNEDFRSTDCLLRSLTDLSFDSVHSSLSNLVMAQTSLQLSA